MALIALTSSGLSAHPIALTFCSTWVADVAPAITLATVGRDGFPYNGPASNTPRVDLSATGGAATGFATTAQVVSAGLKPGEVGKYEIVLEVGPGVTPNPNSQFSLSQGLSTSNIVTIPIAPALQQ